METSVPQWRSGVRASAKALGWQQALCGQVRAAQAVLYSEFIHPESQTPLGALGRGPANLCLPLETGWRQRGNESGRDKECF